MSNPIKQHYIPKSLLRRFATHGKKSKKKNFLYNKETGYISCELPKNIMFQLDLLTNYPDNKNSLEIEQKIYNEMESEEIPAPLIERYLKQFIPRLRQEEEKSKSRPDYEEIFGKPYGVEDAFAKADNEVSKIYYAHNDNSYIKRGYAEYCFLHAILYSLYHPKVTECLNEITKLDFFKKITKKILTGNFFTVSREKNDMLFPLSDSICVFNYEIIRHIGYCNISHANSVDINNLKEIFFPISSDKFIILYFDSNYTHTYCIKNIIKKYRLACILSAYEFIIGGDEDSLLEIKKTHQTIAHEIIQPVRISPAFLIDI